MRIRSAMAGLWAFAALAACQSFPDGTSVADYCANADNSNDPVCQLNVEINGQRTALAETSMELSEARSLASDAMTTSTNAMSLAEQAMARANQAASLEERLACETRVVQKSNVGTCAAGQTLMSCTQTRYTYRAGGPSILREIDDQMCRFHDQVLEMRVRCCSLDEPATFADAGL